jgi:hypothetical protein
MNLRKPNLAWNLYEPMKPSKFVMHVDITNFHPSIKIWHVALWTFLSLKIIFFLKYWSPSFIMIINDGAKIMTWHNKDCHMAY